MIEQRSWGIWSWISNDRIFLSDRRCAERSWNSGCTKNKRLLLCEPYGFGKEQCSWCRIGLDTILWNAENKDVRKLEEVQGDNAYPTSVAWSENARSLSVGCMKSRLQIWDPETSKSANIVYKIPFIVFLLILMLYK